MAHFHARAEIGLRAENPARLSLRSGDDLAHALGLTVHHTGYGGTLYHPDPIQRLRGIQAYHMDTLGYGDIAYEAAFDADGNVFACRDAKYDGAHALGTRRGGGIPNRLTDGVVYLEDARRWTAEASAALIALCDVWSLVRGHRPTLFAHEWWSFTECPGDYLINVVKFCNGVV